MKIDVIFPVSKEITIVADVRRPDITALEEAKTVNAGVAGSTKPLGGDRGGVG